jgi:opacity protein-like surface antigen
MLAKKAVKTVVLLAIIVFVGIAAHAQVPTSGNIFFGYSYSGGNVFLSSAPERQAASHTASLNGWEGSLEGKFLPWIGIVADLSGHYGSHDLPVCGFILPPCSISSFNAKRYTILFGPRVSVSVGKFTPFAHALIGASHISDSSGGISDSDTSLATAIGGGLDYKLIKGLAWRVQGDELHTRFFGGGQDHFRFSTGIVLRF